MKSRTIKPGVVTLKDLQKEIRVISGITYDIAYISSVRSEYRQSRPLKKRIELATARILERRAKRAEKQKQKQKSEA